VAKKGNGKNGGKRKPKASPDFRRGFAAGYDQGLSECGPVAGVTRYFERGRKRGKIAAGHAQAKQKALEEAATRHEAQRAAESQESMEALAGMGNPVRAAADYPSSALETNLGWGLFEATTHEGLRTTGSEADAIPHLLRAKMIKRSGKGVEIIAGKRYPYTQYEITAKGRRTLEAHYPDVTHRAREMAETEGNPRANRGPIPQEKWLAGAITRKGKLGGKGFLSKPRETQKRILAKCQREYGYRSCLGSVMVLERIPETNRKYGRTLAALRKWLVKEYGGPGSFGPRKAGRLLQERGRRRAIGNPKRVGDPPPVHGNVYQVVRSGKQFAVFDVRDPGNAILKTPSQTEAYEKAESLNRGVLAPKHVRPVGSNPAFSLSAAQKRAIDSYYRKGGEWAQGTDPKYLMEQMGEAGAISDLEWDYHFDALRKAVADYAQRHEKQKNPNGRGTGVPAHAYQVIRSGKEYSVIDVGAPRIPVLTTTSKAKARRVADLMNAGKNPGKGAQFMLVPEIADCPACMLKTNPEFEGELWGDEEASPLSKQAVYAEFERAKKRAKREKKKAGKKKGLRSLLRL
jgi:hypothetical protein